MVQFSNVGFQQKLSSPNRSSGGSQQIFEGKVFEGTTYPILLRYQTYWK